MRRGFAFATLLGALALLASCAEDDDAGQSPTATQASTSTPAAPTSATPPSSTYPPGFDPSTCSEQITVEKCLDAFTHTPEPAPTPRPPDAAYPAGTHTGVAGVDAVIDAIERRDARAVADLVVFSTYPCQEPRPVQPQPLRCREGQQPGDPLTGIWVSHVEGGLWPDPPDGDREKLVPAFERVLGDSQRALHAVYRFRGDERPASGVAPRPEYAVIFTRHLPGSGPEYDSFMVRDGGLVSIEFAFPPLPPERWEDRTHPGWVLSRAR
ncbi:MAG TPA: hypothetical protein VFY90_11610 [Tepidiformaceae bacterium]|nr:hypothetical protein [Tepidiformaceae bacterium]